MTRRLAIALGLMLGAVRLTSAQALSGTVTDSASRQPIPGAVVVLLDAAGGTIARTLSNARGNFHFPESRRSERLRLVRLGFRPREIALRFPLPQPLDVRMVMIPTLLEQVRVVDNPNCPRRDDRMAAFAILEQARAGLLNAVVARETYPAAMTVLPFERFFDGTSSRVDSQNVRIKSGERVKTSFQAVRTAREFVQDGFSADDRGGRVYFGPDIDVLLDAHFTAGYCFHLRARDREHPARVGVAFTPARRRAGRVDIDGTLWLDTAARKLVGLEYRYLGLPVWVDPVQPGGRSTFWELSNGIVFIDKWNFRLPVPHYDTTYGHRNEMRVRTWYSAREPGGEVSNAQWPDGHTYQGPLGILNARALDLLLKPVTGIVVRLSGTDYVASPDSQGFFAIGDLLPGPYTAIVIDPALADSGITLPSSLRFVAVRDSIVQASMVVPDRFEHVKPMCSANAADRRHPRVATDSTSLLRVIVSAPDKMPVAGVRWRISKETDTPWQRVTESRLTDSTGTGRSCLRLERGDVVDISAWREGEHPRAQRYRVDHTPATYHITLPFAAKP